MGTIITIMTKVIEGGSRAFLSLLSWVSPAFPTGSYAYSHGVEWAVSQGDVRDVASLCDWLEVLLLHGSLGNDLVFLHYGWQRAEEGEALRELAEYARACASSRERYEETLWQGDAFMRAACVWQPELETLRQAFSWPLPVAQGLVFRRGGVTKAQALLAGAYNAVAALVSATVRLVPLGQTDGLRALKRLDPVLEQAVEKAERSTFDDLGGVCFYADMAAMRHETQRTRLFRT
ncbi:urease accessory protein UreF [Acetobacteraceae bacterium ESL0709]|nr:urease accessory protein UreF [Acetobacteraceae bacterium ESL0697]MDF7677635.1 urease accessory protein UreF [Acetobacteraceae bacterium ESL0709]